MNLEPEAQDKKVETATKSQRPNNLNKKQIIKDLWKTIGNKSASHQLKAEEMTKCGISEDKHDKVREAISKANSSGQNIVFSALAWFFGTIGNFIDSIFKVILIAFVFLLSLQLPYLNEHANQKSKEIVQKAESGLQKHEETLSQFKQVLAKYKIKEQNAEQEIPATVKEDKESALRWLKYKDKTVESIWKELKEKPFNSGDKVQDLSFIYGESWKNYSPGLPHTKNAYVNSGILGLLALIVYLVLQSLINSLLKKRVRYLAIKHEVQKVI